MFDLVITPECLEILDADGVRVDTVAHSADTSHLHDRTWIWSDADGDALERVLRFAGYEVRGVFSEFPMVSRLS